MVIQDGFTFYRPCELLRRYVRYYWVLRSRSGMNELTFPVGCPQIIFHKKSPLYVPELNVSQPMFAVSGQVNFPSHLQSTGELEMIVAVFYPHVLWEIFGVPVSELYNVEVSGYDISDRKLRLYELAGSVYDTDDSAECVRLIERWLLSVLDGKTITLGCRRIREALGCLFADTGTTVRRLADRACLSERQFARTFRTDVGMGPKEYARIARFQKSLYMMQQGVRDFSAIAYECGYADQSHFIRECRTYSSQTPTALLERGAVYSDLFSSPV